MEGLRWIFSSFSGPSSTEKPSDRVTEPLVPELTILSSRRGAISASSGYSLDEKCDHVCVCRACKTLGGPRLTRFAWVLDSGASAHLVNDREMVTTLSTVNFSFRTADGGNFPLIGIGNVKIDIINEAGRITCLELKDALYAPSADGNLISLNKLAVSGLRSV